MRFQSELRLSLKRQRHTSLNLIVALVKWRRCQSCKRSGGEEEREEEREDFDLRYRIFARGDQGFTPEECQSLRKRDGFAAGIEQVAEYLGGLSWTKSCRRIALRIWDVLA